MTPKFIQLTRMSTGEVMMVNPRRINAFHKRRPPTQQPKLNCGTEVWFGRDDVILVRESVEDIKTLLK